MPELPSIYIEPLEAKRPEVLLKPATVESLEESGLFPPDDDIMRFSPPQEFPFFASAKAFMGEASQQDAKTWEICHLLGSDAVRPVGMAGLSFASNWGPSTFTFILDGTMHGRGIGTAVGHGLAAYTFGAGEEAACRPLLFSEVVASHLVSLRVREKIGFVRLPEMDSPGVCGRNGERTDQVQVWALFNPDMVDNPVQWPEAGYKNADYSPAIYAAHRRAASSAAYIAASQTVRVTVK